MPLASLQPLIRSLLGSLERLVCPHPALDPDRNYQARLLSALLLVLCAGLLAALLYVPTPDLRPGLGALLTLSALLYGASRSRHYLPTAVLTAGSLLVVPISLLVTRPDLSESQLIQILGWGALGLVLAGLLLDTPWVVGFIVINHLLLGLSSRTFARETFHGFFYANAFDLTMGLLLLLFTVVRQRDARQRQAAEHAFMESEERFRLLFERAPVGIALCDPDGLLIETNDAFQQMYGYHEDELRGTPAKALTRSAIDLGTQFLRILSGEQQVISGEAKALHRDGSEFWVRMQANGLHDPGGDLTVIAIMVENISDLKLAEEALRKEEERWQLAVQGSNDGLWDLDLRGNDHFFSDRLLDMLGLTTAPATLSLADFFGYIHPEDRPGTERAFAEHMGRRRPRIISEFRIRQPDGSYRWLLARGQAVWDQAGHPVRIIGSTSDHTERKQDEMALIEAREAAIRASRAKSEFLATMSHEMRTPLNAIIGLTDVLRDTPLNDDQQGYLTVLKRAGRNLHTLINGVLDLAKIESGQMELEAIDFDLGEVLAEVTEILTLKAAGQGLSLQTYLAPGVARHLNGDPYRLRQILLNLVGNAIKFTTEGHVEVRIEPLDVPGHLHLSVTDTGIGIPSDQLERIFQSFTQVDSSTTRQFGGSGLGLAITKHLVELMGGQIGAESQAGQGSTFHVWLPLHCARTHELPAAASIRPAAERTPGRPMQLLLVEDNADNRLIFGAFLKGLPHRIVQAHNGLEGLQAFHGEAFDLVLMDLQMPEMDGFTAMQQIRAWEREAGRRPTPIVALSAASLEEDVVRSLMAGATSHLAKPLQKSDVLDLLDRYQPMARQEQVRVTIRGDFAELIPEYLANRRLDLLRVRAAMGRGELDVIRRIGHDIKGSGGSFGFPALSEGGQTLEKAAKAADAAAIQAWLESTESYLANLEVEFV